MHTRDVVKSQKQAKTIKNNLLSGAHWEPEIYFRAHSQKLQVIMDAHPKEFIGVKLHQTV